MSAQSISSDATTEKSNPGNWVDAYGDYLFNLAVGQIRDATVAEDLVQETFLAALRAKNGFQGKSAERTWLVGILLHKIIDYLRRACRERPLFVQPNAESGLEAWEDSLLWLHETASECSSPSRRLELSELQEALTTALGKLPPNIAEVFKLYTVEERSNREVCEKLNISESNLWVMLHRARKQLRTHLSQWTNGRN
jgi:RNA polymerase sigma-70 factor (ECF subfamily)